MFFTGFQTAAAPWHPPKPLLQSSPAPPQPLSACQRPLRPAMPLGHVERQGTQAPLQVVIEEQQPRAFGKTALHLSEAALPLAPGGARPSAARVPPLKGRLGQQAHRGESPHSGVPCTSPPPRSPTRNTLSTRSFGCMALPCPARPPPPPRSSPPERSPCLCPPPPATSLPLPPARLCVRAHAQSHL